MGPSADSVIDLGHDVSLHCTFTGKEAVDWRLQWKAETVLHGTLSASDHQGKISLDNGIIRASGEIDVDFQAGEVSVTVLVEVRNPLADPPTWDTILNLNDAVLLRFDPSQGVVAGSATPHPPVVEGPWGPSGSSGSILRLHIADQDRALLDVGQLVMAEMFSGYSPFTFNVVACCGRPTGSPTGPGVYGDPESRWFNVFFGIYQLDANKSDGWTRPFGYESAAGVSSIPSTDDLLRLGKSDWNWFSNYLYGVPKSTCEQYSGTDPGTTFSPVATSTIGTTSWHTFTMSGVVVASCYQSSAPGAEQLVINSILTAEWRESFGEPCPRAEYTTSFIPTTLMASLTMAYWEDDTAYHTLVFGGTSGVATPAPFLAAQNAAAQAAIAAYYPGAGFSA